MNNGGTQTADSTTVITGTKIESGLCRAAEEHYDYEQLVIKWQMKFRDGIAKWSTSLLKLIRTIQE